ncbi:MAG: hypothetical protein NDI84_02920 [Steroidobacteraceae bacterium]|nr:hypothetical protein [Steroidobacteraceae bacterium]
MNPDLDRALCERYPKIFAKRDDRTSPLCWGIACGDGWYPLLDELCAQLQHETEANGAPQVVASQVKEKNGDLRFHTRTAISQAQQALIASARKRSLGICEICSALALERDLDLNWISTRCEAHEPVPTPEQQTELAEFNAEWDHRLACLREPGAREKLRALSREPIQLNGQVRVGEGY